MKLYELIQLQGVCYLLCLFFFYLLEICLLSTLSDLLFVLLLFAMVLSKFKLYVFIHAICTILHHVCCRFVFCLSISCLNKLAFHLAVCKQQTILIKSRILSLRNCCIHCANKPVGCLRYTFFRYCTRIIYTAWGDVSKCQFLQVGGLLQEGDIIDWLFTL